MPTQPICFIACPIGAEESDVRRRSELLLKFIITPTLESKYRIERSDKIGESGRITLQIAQMLSESDLVIADLTDFNPNIMYEVGLRHALGAPIIHMAQKGFNLPFDLADMRTIPYGFDVEAADAARNQLNQQATAIQEGRFRPPLLITTPFPSDKDNAERDLLIKIHDTVAHLSRDLIGIRDSVNTIKTGVTSIEDSRKEEMAMNFMSKFIGQAIQNPDGITKPITLSEKLKTATKEEPE